MKRDHFGNRGIYAITHRPSGAVYIGSSISISERWASHKRRAINGSQTRLHRLMRERGPGEFDFKVIHLCDREMLLTLEARYIRLFNSASMTGLNTRENPHATYDQRVSEATRERIRAASTGRRHSEETKAKMREAKLGWQPSAETKEKMAAAKRGRKLSDDHRRKIGARHLGAKRDPSVGTKISAAKMGSRKGIPLSAEHRAKIALAGTGRRHSEETRLKMREARTLAWARKKNITKATP